MYTPSLPNGDATVLGIRLELDPQVALLTSLTKRPIRFKSRRSEMRIECTRCCILARSTTKRCTDAALVRALQPAIATRWSPRQGLFGQSSFEGRARQAFGDVCHNAFRSIVAFVPFEHVIKSEHSFHFSHPSVRAGYALLQFALRDRRPPRDGSGHLRYAIRDN